MTNRIIIDLRAACEEEHLQEGVLQAIAELFESHSDSEFMIVARDANASPIRQLRQRLGVRLPARNVRPTGIKEFEGVIPKHSEDLFDQLELGFIRGLGPDAIVSVSPKTGEIQFRPCEQELPTRDGKKKLAVITPLPPERSGIADYAADLIPELCRWYDVDIITDQEKITASAILECCKVKSYSTFLKDAEIYDRILYQIGNSHYHEHMFAMLEKVPGVVTLHDFFLGDVHYQRKISASQGNALIPELYHSHGYSALLELRKNRGLNSAIEKYPCNFSVFRNALGIVAHSNYLAQLTKTYYGADACLNLIRIPLPRAQSSSRAEKSKARQLLGLSEDAPLVCSFGFIGENKLNTELLDAWLQSHKSRSPNAKLVFVGQNNGGPYGNKLAQTIQVAARGRASVTGWVDEQTYKLYLAAADLAVQLRINSRGETSAATMDCLAYGCPLIVNMHGYAIEIPTEVVESVPEKFTLAELSQLIDQMLEDAERSSAIALRARRYMEESHAIHRCAEAYHNAIETFYSCGKLSRYLEKPLLSSVASRISSTATDDEIARISACLYDAIPRLCAGRQVFVDVSILCKSDLHTGIQRVVRALVLALISSSRHGTRIEPVRMSNKGGAWHYRYARTWTSGLLELPENWAVDEPIEMSPGDVFLGADYIGHLAIEAERAGLYRSFQRRGVAVHFVVYDLLPVTMPDVFPPKSDEIFSNWLSAVARSSDKVFCISKSVADDFNRWLDQHRDLLAQRPKVQPFHLGYDFESTRPTVGLPQDYDILRGALEARPTFLMVGTIEPRKGYLQVLAAFDELWRAGTDVNLVVIGREGWKDLPREARRTIPETIERLSRHRYRHQRLFWVSDGSDELLNELYLNSTCLIAASLGEGFGLPLVEAARYDLPIIARDIPVFREVAGDTVRYFKSEDPSALAICITESLDAQRSNSSQSTAHLPMHRWSESALQLFELMMEEQ